MRKPHLPGRILHRALHQDLPARPLLGHAGDRGVLLVGSRAETSGASTSEARASPPASISPVWPIVTVEG
jgi:hypothetical protein